MDTRKITKLSMFLTMAIVLAIVEGLLPPIPIYGAKYGLANIVTLILLYMYTPKEATIVLYLRIILVSILRGTFGSTVMIISASGGTLALLLMILATKLDLFSVIGVSILGSVGHSVGQIIAVSLLSVAQITAYLPYLMAISIVTGIFNALVASKVLAYIDEDMSDE